MYMCIYVCVYVHISLYVCVCVCVRVCVCVYLYIHIFLYARTQMCICITTGELIDSILMFRANVNRWRMNCFDIKALLSSSKISLPLIKIYKFDRENGVL